MGGYLLFSFRVVLRIVCRVLIFFGASSPGDFQYKPVKVPADEIFRISKSQLQKNSTIYLATDEKDINFFKPLTANYDVVFLHDFMDELKGVNTNYYGMCFVSRNV